MQWYYIKNGEKQGPLSNADIPLLVKRGDIHDDTLVWHEKLKDWTPYGTLPPKPAAALASAENPTGATCSMCGKTFDADQLIQFEGVSVCAGCKPNFIQQIKENAEVSSSSIMRYAGFWRRFLAVFIDGLVMSIFSLPANFGFQFAMTKASEGPGFVILAIVLYLSMLLIPAIYLIWMHGRYGATLGKKAVGVKVVMSDGTPISYGRAVGRYFAYMLSGLIMYIGYIMAGFDSEKRALHDHMCNTRVIYT
ncbi:RDD family protein [Pontiellaceae bacterium B1224]|nr:RDD family protein [Pontiellaceae bacterium B1224]